MLDAMEVTEGCVHLVKCVLHLVNAILAVSAHVNNRLYEL